MCKYLNIMLTQQQIKNIHNLSAQMCIDIMHECAERLGVVSVEEYCEVMHMKRRTVYAAIKDEKIPYIEICGHKFPIINY